MIILVGLRLALRLHLGTKNPSGLWFARCHPGKKQPWRGQPVNPEDNPELWVLARQYPQALVCVRCFPTRALPYHFNTELDQAKMVTGGFYAHELEYRGEFVLYRSRARAISAATELIGQPQGRRWIPVGEDVWEFKAESGEDADLMRLRRRVLH